MEYVFLLGITGILSGHALGKKDYGFFIVFFLMAAFEAAI